MQTVRLAFAAFACLLIGSLHAARADFDHAKLRRLAELPGFELEFVIKYNFSGGYSLSTFTPAALPDPAAIRQTLKNDDTDAARYADLGNAYEKQHETLKSVSALLKAVELYQNQLKSSPASISALIGLTNAQIALSNTDNARQSLEKLFVAAPNNAAAWKLKAQMTLIPAVKILHGTNTSENAFGDYAALTTYLAGHTITPEEFTRAKTDFEDAQTAYDKAALSAPDQATAYADRAIFKAVYAMETALLEALRHDQKQPKAAMQKSVDAFTAAFTAPPVYEDMMQAAQRAPGDPLALGAGIYFPVMSAYSKRASETIKGDKLLATLPANVGSQIRAFEARLKILANAPDLRIASDASKMLGMEQFLLETEDSGLPPLRKAVELTPADGIAGDMLILVLAKTGHYEELARVLDQQLKQRDLPLLHMLLAKAYSKLNRSDDAEREARDLMRTHPADLKINLLQAGLLMQRSDAETRLTEISECLLRAVGAAANITHDDWICAAMLRGIYLAISGNSDDARKQFTDIMGYDKDFANAGEALRILDAH